MIVYNYRLDQIKEREDKYPNQVYKVPVQPYFFDHFIMTSSFIDTSYGIIVNQKIEHHPTEYVETMKARYEEKEVCKIRGPILINM